MAHDWGKILPIVSRRLIELRKNRLGAQEQWDNSSV